jgi:hypothetical protein
LRSPLIDLLQQRCIALDGARILRQQPEFARLLEPGGQLFSEQRVELLFAGALTG